MFLSSNHLSRLNLLLTEVRRSNPFYARKWATAGLNLRAVKAAADFQHFPLTTRSELVTDQSLHPPLGSNLTRPQRTFRHFYESSGTSREPLRWCDTAASWNHVGACSRALFRLAGLERTDAVLLVMNFERRSGPWIIREGVRRLGCAWSVADPHDHEACLRWIEEFRPSVLVGHPSNLRALAELARRRRSRPDLNGVRKLVLTGENVQTDATARRLLESHWNAETFHRYGLTEAGSVAAECGVHSGGWHVLDNEFIVESLHLGSTEPVRDGEIGELVLTNLGRIDRPIIRYRTGDLVRLVRRCRCGCGDQGAILLGGVLGRITNEVHSPPPRPAVRPH